MEGYKIEELYYLYRQGCPIAKRVLIEYCYWQIKMMLPAYCYTSANYWEENNDYFQMIIIRCIQSFENYRPDRGMQVKSFISMVIQNGISTIVIKKRGKILKEQKLMYSLDDYFSDDRQLRYIDALKDDRSPDRLVGDQDCQNEIDAFVAGKCSLLEQAIVDYHKLGLKDNDIALMLNKDVRCIYNANYRIQKKMEKSNLFD